MATSAKPRVVVPGSEDGDGPFKAVADHPDCPPTHPHATVDGDGRAVMCHVQRGQAQDLALTLNITGATAAPGGGMSDSPGVLPGGISGAGWRAELHPRGDHGRFADLDDASGGRHTGPGSFDHIRSIEKLADDVDLVAQYGGKTSGTATALRNVARQVGMRQMDAAHTHMKAALTAARREKLGSTVTGRLKAVADSLAKVPKGTYPEPGYGERTQGLPAPVSLQRGRPVGLGYFPGRAQHAAWDQDGDDYIDVTAAFDAGEARDEHGKWTREGLAARVAKLGVRQRVGHNGADIDRTASKGYRVRLKNGQVQHYDKPEHAAQAAFDSKHFDPAKTAIPQPPKVDAPLKPKPVVEVNVGTPTPKTQRDTGSRVADHLLLHPADAQHLTTGELKAADTEMTRRADLLGKHNQVSKTHQAVKDELAERAGAGKTRTPEPPAALKVTGTGGYPRLTNTQAEKWGGKNWPATSPPLPADQRQALREYASGGYKDYNGVLRSGKKPSASDKADMDAIDQALRDHPTPSGVTTVHRGAGLDAFGGTTPDKLIGQTVREPGYLSTSVGRDVTGGFTHHDAHIEIKVPAGTPAYYLDNLTGFKGERELLLARGLQYKITGAKKDRAGTWQVTAEIVPAAGAASAAAPDVTVSGPKHPPPEKLISPYDQAERETAFTGDLRAEIEQLRAHTAGLAGKIPAAVLAQMQTHLKALLAHARSIHPAAPAAAAGLDIGLTPAEVAAGLGVPEWIIRAASAPAGHGDAQRLRDYWTDGEGAAKIRWGTNGDFDRCVAEVGKYMADPKGYCNLRHHEALGIWPAQHAEMVKKAGGGMADAAAFDEAAHPRVPAGGGGGGQFAPASGGGADKRTTPTDANPVGQGMTGAQVSDLQKRLNALGAKPPLKVDGAFGPKTLAAVKAYQKAHGLKVDGLVGPKTTAALRLKVQKSTKDKAKTSTSTSGTKDKAKTTTTAPLSQKPGTVTTAQKTQVGKLLTERQVAGPDATDMKQDLPGMSAADADGLIKYLQKQPVKKTAAAAAPSPATGATVPALITIPGVDILAAGTWQLSTGRQTFSRQDLADAVQAAACPAVGQPVIKIGHLDQRFVPKPEDDGEPAIGRVTNMRLTDDGHKIAGDLAGMPGWLGAVAASAFPRRSIEGKYRMQCQIGHTHPFVVTALALLGVTPPGVGVLGGLNDIARLYGVTTAAAADAWRTEPIEQEGDVMAVTEEDVRRAYYANAGAPPAWWITEMQMEPTQLIVADEQSGKVYRVPFSISGAAVQFAPPQEVASYADVAASRGGGTIVAYASAEQSRAVTAAWDGPAAVKALGDDPADGAVKAMFAVPGGSKSDSKLPHHDVADGHVGAANPAGCAAAIGALNGAMGGVKGLSDDERQAAYEHLAAHLKAAGQDPPELAAAAKKPAPSTSSSEDGGDGDSEDYGATSSDGGSASSSDGTPGDSESSEDTSGMTHGPFSGPHTHPHSAFGTQGEDASHAHEHSHDNNADHNHTHGTAASEGAGGSDMEFTQEQLAGIRAKLGKKDGEEITAADIFAAFSGATPVAASAGGQGAVQVPEVGDGAYLIDGTVIRDWQQRALAGDFAVRQLSVRDRDTVLSSAMNDGKFPQARLEHYQAMWDKDPDGTRKYVDTLASGFVPVTGPVGSNGAFDPEMGGDFEGQQAYRDLYPDDSRGAVSAGPGVHRG